MPATKNALIRYKTIDACLKNRFREWTLDDLVEACSEALYEYEGIRKGISRRSVQMDIQMMRSEKLGYNAPIVIHDQKYYTYEDPDYSITNIPLNEDDLNKMSDAVEVLKQFKGFKSFEDLTSVISRLENQIATAKTEGISVINFEKNDDLHGLDYLDTIYRAIRERMPLKIQYKSFNYPTPLTWIFYPYLLKEYRNRWFVFGARKDDKKFLNPALDRMLSVEIAEEERYYSNTYFEPDTFFDDVIGVTKELDAKAERILFSVRKADAPYVETKPLHHSQKVVGRRPDGSIVCEITVVINPELFREILGFGEGIRILEPRSFADSIAARLRNAATQYEDGAV
ncbi:MAG: WYL domain-containing protein [Bacteroidales bacterium]|jgi:predicted DNA-binding transcriptional regulator YafY|nr:WYL domain-containing protein [Bacteroidales bacterium]